MGASDNLSNNLILLRRARRLTQISFARELGISKSTLQEIERGHGPTLDTLECISHHLDIPASALIADELTPDQAGFLLLLLHGNKWFRQWSGEDLELLRELSDQLFDLLKKYHGDGTPHSKPH